jgi:hypothetical protein
VIPPHLPPVPHSASLVYGDPLFRATADIARHFSGSRLRGLLAALTRRPATLLRVLFAVARLPIVEVCITSAEAAALFSRDFAPISAPIFGGRLAQAVLDLEPDDQTYLSGRSRQALRTNMKHAQKRGVEVTRVASYGEWSAATQEILGSREGAQERLAQLRPPPDTQDMGYFVAVDDTGHAVAISAVAIFSDYAMLVWSLSAPDHPAASSSRYLLHTYMRSNLRGQGVRHLIAGTGVRDAPGLHYFQHLLGYQVRNLRIRVRDGAATMPAFVPGAYRGVASEVACALPGVDATVAR